MSGRRLLWQLSACLLLLGGDQASSAQPETRPVEGLRQNNPAVHALTNARLILAPGRVVERGTLVIRDGVITAAGATAAVPGDARVWDLSGKTIYPGLIDAYAEIQANAPAGGAGYWNPLITPHVSLAEQYKPDGATNEKLRAQGIVARLMAPASGVIKGESVLVTTGKENGDRAILRPAVALHMRLGIPRGRSRETYPASPMGAVALARQAMHDSAWYGKAWAAHQGNSSLGRPERNDALAALQKYLDGQRMVIIDSANELYFLRADAFAREFSLQTVIRGSGQEYQRLDAIRGTGRAIILPVNFPKPPNVNTPEAARNVELNELLHWDIAPENPARLVEAGVTIALTSAGLKDVSEFLGAVRTAVERGLPADEALRALTTTPAELFGVAERLGTLEAGKAANLVVTDGDLFVKRTKVLETWIDGQRHEVEKRPVVEPRGTWQINLPTPEGQAKSFELQLSGTFAQITGTIKVRQPEEKTEEVKLSKVELRDVRLSATFDAKAFGKTGLAQLSALIIAPREGTPTLAGSLVWPDATQVTLTGVRTAGPSPESERPADEPKKEAPAGESKKDESKPAEKEKPASPDEPATNPAEPKKGEPKKPDTKKEEGAPDKPKTKEPTEKESPQEEPQKANPTEEPANPPEPAKTDEPSADPAQPMKAEPKKPDTKKEEGAPDKSKKPEPAKESEPSKEEDKKQQAAEAAKKKEADQAKAAEKPETPKVDPKASFGVNFPLSAFGRGAAPQQPPHLLLKNATVWTCGPQGVLEKASVLVESGKIVAVGAEVAAPDGAMVVDLAGKHLAPGIIDCHSHMATDGGVNEATQAITAEVRIGDFIDCNDIDIYRQLAGGVTSANILHGSANPIGGQNQVIKLRWGALPEEMKFTEAPPGIKFALGENPKQSNWGDNYTTRYPQSRMGVEQIIRDAFQAAREYKQAWQRWEQKHDTLPPRRDLELDTLLEILEGKRWIHCHSYRQDEILALLRTCEEFNVRVATLQHILEGYKVADAMARHGAMGSAFSDWWAYKFEVYDAIPYAGALMHHAGVVVSFNSDDQELARHLNHEAAKAVKYGNVPPEEALKFVTYNPAKQLRIDQYVGSIEPGKHADLVVWSGPPLSVFSRCEQTWIDGRKYFDRAEDKIARDQANTMRHRLVQKILASGQTMKTPEESKKPDEELWPRVDIFCRAQGRR